MWDEEGLAFGNIVILESSLLSRYDHLSVFLSNQTDMSLLDPFTWSSFTIRNQYSRLP